ncbi:substrate-binding periplasmic protein [Silvanigrella paludirubra]|nr:transporter substrate-binding domain-containing protein [Silvanigrella paludirubra]
MIKLFLKVNIFITIIFTNYCFGKEFYAATEAWIPYVYQDKDNNPKGIDYFLCKKIFKSLGIDFKLDFLPWLRVLDMLKKNEKDGILDVIKNPEREKFMIFSSRELSTIDFAIFYKKNKPFKYENLNSFTGKTIAIMRGYSYPKDFLEAKNFIKVDITGDSGSERNFKKLIYDRVDLVIENKTTGLQILKKLGEEKNVTLTEKSLDKLKLYLSFSMKYKNDDLVKYFNNELSKIKRN